MGCDVDWAPQSAAAAAAPKRPMLALPLVPEVPPCKCSTEQPHTTMVIHLRTALPTEARPPSPSPQQATAATAPNPPPMEARSATHAIGGRASADAWAKDASLLDASAAPDVNDFTTWTPETWSRVGRVDFSKISFPADPMSASVPSGPTWRLPCFCGTTKTC